jgi:uncharacterized delta-60 repeat protein
MLVLSGAVASRAAAGDGGLETSWASTGIRVLPWAFAPVGGTTDLSATPDGRLLLVGSDDTGIGCVTRLTAAGALDPTFGAAGASGSVCDLDNGDTGAFQAVQTTQAGGLVTAAVTPGNRVVARLDAAGGVEFVNEVPGNHTGSGGRVLDVAPLGDGRTALLETRDASGAGWVLLFEESGSLLTEWAVPSPDAGHAFAPRQILPGPGRSIVLVGELERDAGSITAALRTDQDGGPDTGFSSDGFSDGPPSSGGTGGRGALGPGGTLVLAAADGSSVAVRRLTTAGQLDTTFRTTGASATLPAGTDGVSDVVVRPDGRAFLTFHDEPGSTAIHVVRLTSAGSLDTSFDVDGYAVYVAGADVLADTTSAAAGPQGDLFVLARSSAAGSEPAVIRVDGTNDVAAPVPSTTAPSGLWTLSRSVPLAWTARDASPVASYDVRTRRATYRGSLPASPTLLVGATTARARTVTGVAEGSTLCMSVRARDVWGLTSAWVAERCTSVPLAPSQLQAGKGVKSKPSTGTYAGKVLVATKKGATIKRSGVTAKRLALVATTCARCGKVKVYLGSDLLRTVSLKSPGTRKRAVISIATFSRVRSGTVKIKVVSSGKKVRVEGLGVSKV